MNTKKLTSIAVLTAMAVIAGMFIRIRFMPGAPFLTYDPKDVVIVIGGFMFGPLAAIYISFATAFIEMVTVSDSGLIGMVMNFLASAFFAAPAAFIYKKMRNIWGAVLGLAAGIFFATSAMLLWNIFAVPLYTGLPREVVLGMILPIFLPFNLIKTGLNASVAMLLYKPLSAALKAARLVNPGEKTKIQFGIMLVAALVAAGLIAVILIYL